ncbi:MAG TPA: hypothetical protein VFV81_07715 [Verrucomicrobiae bacterium]|nr:hypothetical protein [Verrucomicrobiae bacterium]
MADSITAEVSISGNAPAAGFPVLDFMMRIPFLIIPLPANCF